MTIATRSKKERFPRGMEGVHKVEKEILSVKFPITTTRKPRIRKIVSAPVAKKYKALAVKASKKNNGAITNKETSNKRSLLVKQKKRQGKVMLQSVTPFTTDVGITGYNQLHMKWKAGENLCMLHAIYNLMSYEQKHIVTLNGTMDVRDVFKIAVGAQGKDFVRGTTSTDAHKFFQYVSKHHYKTNGVLVRYSFKELGYNNDWTLKQLHGNLCRSGKYVFFGATRKNNASHKNQLHTIEIQLTDEDKMTSWSNGKPLLNDHAIGVDIDLNMNGTIYDNGCSNGYKLFSIQNLATRMRWVNQCFLMDIYVV